jgi:hypothetical protein
VEFIKLTLSPMVPAFRLFAADAFPAVIANANVATANVILFMLSPVIYIDPNYPLNCLVCRLPVSLSRLEEE